MCSNAFCVTMNADLLADFVNIWKIMLVSVSLAQINSVSHKICEAEGPFGFRSGSVGGLFGVRSGSVRVPLGIRLGSVRDPFQARSPLVRGPKIFRRPPAAAKKKRIPGGF